MPLKNLFGKRVWCGFAGSLLLLAAWIMLGALLVVKQVIPDAAEAAVVCSGCFAASLTGGILAGKGRGERVPALMPAVLLYAVLWVLALATSEPLYFRNYGLWISGCVLGGGCAAFLLSGAAGRKKRKKRQSITAVKRRR